MAILIIQKNYKEAKKQTVPSIKKGKNAKSALKKSIFFLLFLTRIAEPHI